MERSPNPLKATLQSISPAPPRKIRRAPPGPAINSSVNNIPLRRAGPVGVAGRCGLPITRPPGNFSRPAGVVGSRDE